jgi:hypothetical protein
VIYQYFRTPSFPFFRWFLPHCSLLLLHFLLQYVLPRLVVRFVLMAPMSGTPLVVHLFLCVLPLSPRCLHAQCVTIKLAQDLQNNLFDNECGEDAHEVIRLTFREFSDYIDRHVTDPSFQTTQFRSAKRILRRRW